MYLTQNCDLEVGSMSAHGPTEADIIVIGGGTAGLKAAIDMAQSGKQVILLEAKDHLGGRVFTDQFAGGTAVEMGASYWEGTPDNPFFQQFFSQSPSDATKPSTTFLGFELSEFYTHTGEQLDTMEVLGLFQQVQKMVVRGYQSGLNQGCKNTKEFIEKLDYTGLDENEKELAKQLIGSLLVEMATSTVEQGAQRFYYEEPQEVEKYNDETALNTFVTGGYSKIIDQMEEQARKLGVKILTRTPVTKIADRDDSVEVTDEFGTQYSAKKAICAIPGAVIKQTPDLFDPPLTKDKEKWDAFQRLGVHEGCRVALEFEEPFWENAQGSYIFITSEEGKLMQFRNASSYTGSSVLTTDSYAKVAQKLLKETKDQAQAEQALIKHIMTDFQNAFPGKDIPSPIGVRIHNWSADPYARGAYPYTSPTEQKKDKDRLQQNSGSIYFAGDYTSFHGCSVHNAYASGERAANQVNYKLQQEQRRKKRV